MNILEFEEEAKKKLQPATFAQIAGGDRAMFDRITLRPRMNIPTTDMDLSVTLFGEEHFTPIIVAPIADQKRFHPDAELATAKGASAGKALMIVSSRSSVPLAEIAAVARPSFWYQVYASDSAAKIAGAGRDQSRRESDCDHGRCVACGKRRASGDANIDQLVGR